MSERSSCGALFGNVKISDLDFADDAVIFVETLDIITQGTELGVGAIGIIGLLSQDQDPGFQ